MYDVYIHPTIPSVYIYSGKCHTYNICILLSYFTMLYFTLYTHVQWTGKCIGKKNIAYFYAFLWTVAAHVAFVIAVTIYATIIGLHVYELQ